MRHTLPVAFVTSRTTNQVTFVTLRTTKNARQRLAIPKSYLSSVLSRSVLLANVVPMLIALAVQVGLAVQTTQAQINLSSTEANPTAQSPVNQSPVAQSRADRPQTPLLPRQLVTFEVVLGRLQLSSESYRIGSAHERIPLDEDRLGETAYRVRSIVVSVARGKPTLQFQDVGGAEDWKVQFKSGHQAEIHFSPLDDRQFSSWRYYQPVEGAIAIEVEFKNQQPARRIESPSLWHMQLADPVFFRTCVEPVLIKLEPQWDFARTGEEIKRLMNEQAVTSDSQSSAASLAQSLAKLDSGNSATRAAGSVEIERLGLAAKAQLHATLAESISNRQRSAVNRLLSVLQPTGNDSAMRIAVWLGGEASGVPTNAVN